MKVEKKKKKLRTVPAEHAMHAITNNAAANTTSGMASRTLTTLEEGCSACNP